VPSPWADNISLDLSISNTHGTQQCLRVDSKRSVNENSKHFFWTNLPIPIFPTHEHDYQNQYAVCCCKYAHRHTEDRLKVDLVAQNYSVVAWFVDPGCCHH
jgi:hypothetical protein